MVERDLAKVEVASSTLVSRSRSLKEKGKRKKDKVFGFTFSFILSPLSFNAGGVAKW